MCSVAVTGSGRWYKKMTPPTPPTKVPRICWYVPFVPVMSQCPGHRVIKWPIFTHFFVFEVQNLGNGWRATAETLHVHAQGCDKASHMCQLAHGFPKLLELGPQWTYPFSDLFCSLAPKRVSCWLLFFAYSASGHKTTSENMFFRKKKFCPAAESETSHWR